MKIFVSIFLMILCYTAPAQRRAENWIFGSVAWLNFSSGSPEGRPISNGPASTSATMSDENGNLLYYGSGSLIYNRQFRLIKHTDPGFVLSGTDPLWNVQGAMTFPHPGNDSLYYYFYVQYNFHTNYVPRLAYAIINMKRDGGLGEVISRDNILLNGDSICPKLTASLHCNKKDVWVCGHLKNSDKYFSLAVTPSGVSATPVYSTSPNFINESHPRNAYGYMKINAMADKMAAAYQGDMDFIELADFNAVTGQITSFKKLVTRPPEPVYQAGLAYNGPFNMEFSPAGDLLYTGSIYQILRNGNITPWGHLHQFDLSSGNETSIQASRWLVDSRDREYYNSMQLAVDGKIYMAAGIAHYIMRRINNPGIYGPGINYDPAALQITAAVAENHLPNILSTYLRYPVIAVGNCQFRNISFQLRNTVGISSVLWDFGDPASGAANSSSLMAPTHIYSAQGTYEVKLVINNANGCTPDTIRKLVTTGPYPVFLGNDTAFCQGDSLRLSLNIPRANYYWNDGSTDSAMMIKTPGRYWVRVNVGECIASDTIDVTVRSLPQFTLGPDTSVCGNQPPVLQPQPGYAAAQYLWNDNTTGASLTAATPGMYWLRMTDQYGCRFRDSIQVTFKTLPSFNLGNDTSLCEGQTYLLQANVNANSYLWNTGVTARQISVSNTGWYWCDATLNGCTYRDSIYVLFRPNPVVQLGPDTTLCEDVSYILNVNNPNAVYLWQDGSNGPSFTVTQPGAYRVKVTINGCERSDTMLVKYDMKPRVQLGPDISYCPGMQIVLKPEIQYAQSLLWQDGSATPSITVAREGLYHVTAINDCGMARDSVQLVKGVCKLYVPTAFTPNGDGLNDVFKAQFGEGITKFKMMIYNRWGQQVFFSENKNEGWTGQLNGKNLSSGVYAWMITYKEAGTENEQRLKGTVLLIR